MINSRHVSNICTTYIVLLNLWKKYLQDFRNSVHDNAGMILEEFVGTLISLGSLLVTQTPPISRENLQRHYWLIFGEHPENEEEQGLIHREYELEQTTQIPYYEDLNVSVSTSDEFRTQRTVCESLRRSFHVNFVLLLAVVLIGVVTTALVYVDLNTTDSCIEWQHFNLTVPPTTKVLQIVGTSAAALPLYMWFPISISMLWGFKEFKHNYLSCLFSSCFIGTIAVVYRAIFWEQYRTTAKYRYTIVVVVFD